MCTCKLYLNFCKDIWAISIKCKLIEQIMDKESSIREIPYATFGSVVCSIILPAGPICVLVYMHKYLPSKSVITCLV